MPPDKRTGPQGTTPEARIYDSTLAGEAAIRLATPLRRRREAAWRLPVLAGGNADPFGALAGLPVAVVPCARAVVGMDGRWRACCRRAAP